MISETFLKLMTYQINKSLTDCKLDIVYIRKESPQDYKEISDEINAMSNLQTH